MRRLMTGSLAVAAICVLSACVSATMASAALPEFSPGAAGTTFTGTSGKGTLETKAKGNIICETNEDKGEMTGTSKKSGTLTIDFHKCKALGFAANSVGDAAEVILTPALR